MNMGIKKEDYEKVLEKCAVLTEFRDYRMYDYISILLNTVLDFQMKSPAVAKAFNHYRENNWSKIRTHSELKRFLQNYPNTKKSNTHLANDLWGNNHWTRAKLLRSLVNFFESQNIRGYKSLKNWIKVARFDDVEAQVRVIDSKTGKVIHSIGPVLFEWLRLRLGEKTVKADVHIKNFIQDTIGYIPAHEDIIFLLKKIANEISVEPRELDAAIWHHMSGY